ncbi:hypothetical protein V8B97DRAFT_2110306 [Scleroderma yunnanense]
MAPSSVSATSAIQEEGPWFKSQGKKHFDCIGRFRDLAISRSNAGKTTPLQRMHTIELPEIFNSKGEKGARGRSREEHRMLMITRLPTPREQMYITIGGSSFPQHTEQTFIAARAGVQCTFGWLCIDEESKNTKILEHQKTTAIWTILRERNDRVEETVRQYERIRALLCTN